MCLCMSLSAVSSDVSVSNLENLGIIGGRNPDNKQLGDGTTHTAHAAQTDCKASKGCPSLTHRELRSVQNIVGFS